MTCPDENSLIAFATGGLGGPARTLIEQHIDECLDCAQLACDAAQFDEPEVDSDSDTVVGAPDMAALPPNASVQRPEELAAGTVLGRYMILRLLASGGIGQVYVAYDPDLDRKVALKLLRTRANDTVPDASAQRWLLREAQAMARLSHPNVVPVHDVGTHATGVFVAMELIEGVTFSQWLRTSERPWREVRDLLLEAGHGLVAAHEAGLVHRDFKPANILVGDDGRVRVVDFGLARAVAGPDAAPDPQPDLNKTPGARLLDQPLTETGTIVGTPPFMAVEQFRGRNVGPWSDQFAFCATLYFGLYRARPFPQRDLKELRDAIFAGDVTPPKVDAPVPDWLHRAVLRGLRPEAGQRHPSMAALLHALTRDRRSRRKQWAAIALAAVVSATGAAVATVALAPTATAHDQEAIERIVARARDAAERAYFVYPPSADAEAQTAYSSVLELEAMTGPAGELARTAAAELRLEFAATLVRLGDEYWAREKGAAFASDFYGAAVLFGTEDDKASDRMLLTPGQVASLEKKARDRTFTAGELQTAETLAALADADEANRHKRVAAIMGQPKGPPMTVRAQLGELFGPTGGAVAAKASAPSPEGVPTPTTEPSPEPGRPAKSHKASRRAEAKQDGAPSESGAEESPLPRDPAAAKEEVKLGRSAFKQGRYKSAGEHFHRALAHDSSSAAAVGGLCEVYFELKDNSTAVKFGKRAVARAPKNANYRLLLGDVYLKLLRYKDARASYELAAKLGHANARARLEFLQKKMGEAG